MGFGEDLGPLKAGQIKSCRTKYHRILLSLCMCSNIVFIANGINTVSALKPKRISFPHFKFFIFKASMWWQFAFLDRSLSPAVHLLCTPPHPVSPPPFSSPWSMCHLSEGAGPAYDVTEKRDANSWDRTQLATTDSAHLQTTAPTLSPSLSLSERQPNALIWIWPSFFRLPQVGPPSTLSSSLPADSPGCARMGCFSHPKSRQTSNFPSDHLCL